MRERVPRQATLGEDAASGVIHQRMRGEPGAPQALVDRGSTRAPFLVGWGALWAAIALNVSQVFLLDGSDGLRRPALLPVAVAGFLVELWLFARAMRCVSPVLAYAAYGATPAVVTLLSVAAFGEALTVPKLVGVAVVTVGIVLLATAAPDDTEGEPQS